MKKLRIIFICAVVSFSVQTIILYYFSNFYFTNDTHVNYKQIDLQPVTSKKLEIPFEQNAEKITLSPSGKYCSYYLDKNLNIINLYDGSKNTLNLEKDIDNYYFKWHDSEDRLIISEKITTGNKSGIKIYNYNPKNNTKLEALNYNNNSEIYNLPVSTATITDIKLNTMNTIMYLKASNLKDTQHIERLDISEGMNKLPVKSTKIGEFFVIKQKDELIYENLINKKLYMTDKSKNKEIYVSGYNNLKLLYVDKSDDVFIGQMQNNMITKIFKKNFDEVLDNKKPWEIINLAKPVSENDLHILNSGKIYVLDKLQRTAENIENSTKISFKGDYLDINDSGILSSSDQKLTLTSYD